MLSTRSITKELVASCLRHPTRVMGTREGKHAYVKDFSVNHPKVIVSDEKDALVAITLYWVAGRRVKQ